MTVAQIFTTARFLTNTNSVTASDTNLLRALSDRHVQMMNRLSQLKEGYGETTDLQNLVADQENYALPADTLRVKRAEIQWVTNGPWYKVKFYDINETGVTNDTTTIGDEFDTSSPYADLHGDDMHLRPIPTANMTNGLKVWYVARPADFTLTSETPSAPKEYHRLLAEILTIDIRQMKGEIGGVSALREEDIIWEFLKNQVSPRVTDQVAVMKPLYENYE